MDVLNISWTFLYVYMYTVDQGYTNLGVHFAELTKFCTVAFHILGFPVWNLNSCHTSGA